MSDVSDDDGDDQVSIVDVAAGDVRLWPQYEVAATESRSRRQGQRSAQVLWNVPLCEIQKAYDQLGAVLPGATKKENRLTGVFGGLNGDLNTALSAVASKKLEMTLWAGILPLQVGSFLTKDYFEPTPPLRQNTTSKGASADPVYVAWESLVGQIVRLQNSPKAKKPSGPKGWFSPDAKDPALTKKRKAELSVARKSGLWQSRYIPARLKDAPGVAARRSPDVVLAPAAPAPAVASNRWLYVEDLDVGRFSYPVLRRIRPETFGDLIALIQMVRRSPIDSPLRDVPPTITETELDRLRTDGLSYDLALEVKEAILACQGSLCLNQVPNYGWVGRLAPRAAVAGQPPEEAGVGLPAPDLTKREWSAELGEFFRFPLRCHERESPDDAVRLSREVALHAGLPWWGSLTPTRLRQLKVELHLLNRRLEEFRTTPSAAHAVALALQKLWLTGWPGSLPLGQEGDAPPPERVVGMSATLDEVAWRNLGLPLPYDTSLVWASILPLLVAIRDRGELLWDAASRRPTPSRVHLVSCVVKDDGDPPEIVEVPVEDCPPGSP